MVIAIGACSFFAPTAPAIAIDAETPQTAPPAPSVAHKRRSRPSLLPTRKITMKVVTETIVACNSATGPAQITSVNGSVAPSRTIPVLM